MTTTGPDRRHPPEAYREAVVERYDDEHDVGVPVEAVAVALDVSRPTAQRHLADLCDAGVLARRSEVPAGDGGRPRYWYYPTTEDSES